MKYMNITPEQYILGKKSIFLQKKSKLKQK